MSMLRKTFLFVAAAGVAIGAFIQSPSAQTTGADHAAAAQSAMENALKQTGVRAQSSAAAHDKADAAMSGATNPLPTEADRKAAATMSK
jgi:hypothetical protein